MKPNLIDGIAAALIRVASDSRAASIKVAYFGPGNTMRIVRRGNKDMVERASQDAAGGHMWKLIQLAYRRDGTERVEDFGHGGEVAFALHNAIFEYQAEIEKLKGDKA